MPNNTISFRPSDTVSSYVTVSNINDSLVSSSRSYVKMVNEDTPKSVTLYFPDGTTYKVDNAKTFDDIWQTMLKYHEVENKNQTLQESLARVIEVLLRECPQYEEWVEKNFRGLY